MQRTRLVTLWGTGNRQFFGFFRNPWRRFALFVIALLLGNFLGTLIPTSTGQEALWDPWIALILVAITEFTNRLVYGQKRTHPEAWFWSLINTLKMGLLYGLFMGAMQLGS